ncbi:MAG: diaminopimelate epimerase [Magnetococcales bacterium]|nr:diaminopimelate epimerase [Magnetococcales bacterium]
MIFTKMHGLGNDFVVLDHLEQKRTVTPQQMAWLADRRYGVGCDQVVELVAGESRAQARMIIHNADGSQAEMCGNAARCVGLYLRRHRGMLDPELTLETGAGLVKVRCETPELFAVDMGTPKFGGEKSLTVTWSPHENPVPVPGVVVSMGNPHFVVFRPDVAEVPLERVGAELSENAAFPGRTNVEFVQVLDSGRVRMRVWERGAGITPACGTGACAAAVAAAARGATGRRVVVHLDGGDLTIHWQENDRVIMTGPAVEVFQGRAIPP